MDHITNMQIKTFRWETDNRQMKTQINAQLQIEKTALEENVQIDMTVS